MEKSKHFQITFIILSLGYILLGILRLLDTNPNSVMICYPLGSIAIIAGLVRVAFYLIKDDQSRVFRNDLAVGILLIIAGVYIIAQPQNIATSLLPVLLGFSVVFDSVLKLQYSFELKRTHFKFWWVVLLVSVVTAVLGSLLILGSFEGEFLTKYFAVVLLVDGVVNLATLGLLVFRLKRHQSKKEQSSPEPPKQIHP